MSSGKPIEHIGVIQEINGFNIQVSFSVQPACSGCHAKRVCTIAGMDNKSVNVIQTGNFNIGEKVRIILKKSLGYKALLLGYLLPFLIVLLTLVLFSLLVNNELMAGLYSLIILIPYYMILYFFREKIRNKFTFIIRKLV